MGGRGASSHGGRGGGIGGGIGAGGGSGNGGKFYDKTSEFKGMALHDFENAIRSKNVEYIGVYDGNGNLIVAGTSNRKGSVAMPDLPAGTDRSTLTVTHNHPSGDGRGIGGTFSPADIGMLAQGGYSQIRAVANGRSEHTYMMTRTSQANPNKLLNNISSAKTTMQNMGSSKAQEVKNRLANAGKSMSQTQYNAVYLGAMKNYWKGVAQSSGYEYVTLKKAPW